MAFGEMNDALAAKGIKKGDVGRNQTGNNGRHTLKTNIAIKPRCIRISQTLSR